MVINLCGSSYLVIYAVSVIVYFGPDISIEFAHFVQMTDVLEVVAVTCTADFKGPQIGRFFQDDGDEEHFIFVEDLVVCKIASLVKAVFFWFSMFYIATP